MAYAPVANFSADSQLEGIAPDQLADIKEVFNVFDTDGGGTVSTKELTEVFQSLGQNPTKPEMEAIVKSIDSDGSGEIDFAEFTVMIVDKLTGGGFKEEILEAFKMFDRDGNGFISASELRHVMSTHGEFITQHEAVDLISLLDVNRDGRIDYKEFVNAFFRNK